jgi:SAM-dependent methyltransferase
MWATRATSRWFHAMVPGVLEWNPVRGLRKHCVSFARSLTAILPVTEDDLPRLTAQAFLRGRGIEIGALHHPLRVPANAIVRYVDRMSVADLRKQYPQLAAKRLVEVDVVDDGERLARFADSSEDFVIANHFLEHCQDPIGALKNMFRVLRPDGVLYMTLPDKRGTFDRDRPITQLSHLRADHERGPAWSRRSHYEEWVRVVNKIPVDLEAEQQIEDLMHQDFSIHFHVWTLREMLEMFLTLSGEIGFEIAAVCNRDKEHTIVLRKRPGA